MKSPTESSAMFALWKLQAANAARQSTHAHFEVRKVVRHPTFVGSYC